jgi:hypothetical protein
MQAVLTHLLLELSSAAGSFLLPLDLGLSICFVSDVSAAALDGVDDSIGPDLMAEAALGFVALDSKKGCGRYALAAFLRGWRT